MNGVKRVTGRSPALKVGPTVGKAAQATKAAPTDVAELQPRGALSTTIAGAIARLIPHPFEPLIGPPPGKPIKATGSLIGLGVEFPDPKASFEDNVAALKKTGLPRFPLLTPIERKHESAFANDVEQHLEFFLE